MKLSKINLIIFLLIIQLFLLLSPNSGSIAADNAQSLKINQNVFDSLSFKELIELSKNKHPKGELGDKLNYILNTPVVDSTINVDTDINQLQQDPKIGKAVRIASWNIERGFKLDQLKTMFTNPDQITPLIKNQNIQEIDKINEQINAIKKANIFVLTEVDNGMPRTGYKNVVQELAKTLNYNYAYGVEFMEVDPAHLGIEDYKWSEERDLVREGILKDTKIDQNRYKGEHGTAILSQFPILSAKIIRLPESYDWYTSEKKRISELEDLKRNAANILFKEDMIREIRQGTRIGLLANIKVPGLDVPVTVVALHLENRTTPQKRAEAMKYLLDQIKDIDNPVVLAGDLNTTTVDNSPTSIKKEVTEKIEDPNFVAKTILLYGIIPAQAFVVNSFVNVSGFARKYKDPTVKNIPIILPNPERELFDAVKKFKFEDGHTFDFRGNGDKSYGCSGELSDSNERDIKGFTPTLTFQKSLFIGKYKIDWFFVKAYLKKPTARRGSNLMAPYYGRTLYDLNYGLKEPFSDHAPITVDLPIQETSNK